MEKCTKSKSEEAKKHGTRGIVWLIKSSLAANIGGTAPFNAFQFLVTLLYTQIDVGLCHIPSIFSQLCKNILQAGQENFNTMEGRRKHKLPLQHLLLLL